MEKLIEIKHDYFLLTDDCIENKSDLVNKKYYYILNHYKEWYIGEYNGESFDFIDNQGNFGSTLFKCYEVIASTRGFRNVLMMHKSKILKLLGKLDVNKYWEQYKDKRLEGMGNSHLWNKRDCESDFIDGFNTHAEISFDLNDIKKIINSMNSEELNELKMREGHGREKGKSIDIYVNNLLKKIISWDVEVEKEIVPDFESSDRDNDGQILNTMRNKVLKIEKGYVNIIKIKS